MGVGNDLCGRLNLTDVSANIHIVDRHTVWCTTWNGRVRRKLIVDRSSLIEFQGNAGTGLGHVDERGRLGTPSGESPEGEAGAPLVAGAPGDEDDDLLADDEDPPLGGGAAPPPRAGGSSSAAAGSGAPRPVKEQEEEEDVEPWLVSNLEFETEEQLAAYEEELQREIEAAGGWGDDDVEEEGK